MLAIISGIFGGVLRLVPEFIKIWNAKGERAHELALMEKTFQLDKQKAELKLEEVKEQSRAEWATGSLDALKLAVESQGKQTGIKWVDAFSSIIRPLITLQWVVILYPAVIIATFWISVNRGTDVLIAMNSAFGEHEKAVCAFILDFWFVGRILDRGRTGK